MKNDVTSAYKTATGDPDFGLGRGPGPGPGRDGTDAPFDERALAERAPVDTRTPQEVIAWALAAFGGDRVAICTSFQADGMVVLDMAWRLAPAVRVFTIDTGRLPAETYDFMELVRQRYRLNLEVFMPDAREVETMVSQHGVNLFYDGVPGRLTCCAVRKVHPLGRALTGLDAWITGLRRDQGASRADLDLVAVDHAHGGLLKINPLAGWSEDEVHAYLRRHDIPTHPLYARGYRTISCAPCSRPVAPGGAARSGRWWWEAGVAKECGMHYAPIVLQNHLKDHTPAGTPADHTPEHRSEPDRAA